MDTCWTIPRPLLDLGFMSCCFISPARLHQCLSSGLRWCFAWWCRFGHWLECGHCRWGSFSKSSSTEVGLLCLQPAVCGQNIFKARRNKCWWPFKTISSSCFQVTIRLALAKRSWRTATPPVGSKTNVGVVIGPDVSMRGSSFSRSSKPSAQLFALTTPGFMSPERAMVECLPTTWSSRYPAFLPRWRPGLVPHSWVMV